MGFNSNITWTHHTFNPVIGCTRVSPGCDHCYAAEHAKTWEPNVRWGGPGQKVQYRRTVESNWRKPLAWNKAAKNDLVSKYRPRVFCASLSDVFDNGWEPEWRKDLWDLIGATPNLDWLLLTKRPQNIAEMLPADWGNGYPNVWLGTSTEDQQRYDQRRLHLLSNPATVHFFSVEPMLSPIIRDLANERGKNVWYICGGESGAERRDMPLQWALDLQQSCRSTDTPFFFKQVSSHKPGIRGKAPDDLWFSKQFPDTEPTRHEARP